MKQVIIHGQSNEKWNIDIDPDENIFENTTISELKNKIFKQKSLPVQLETIRLIYAGKPLEDQKKFKDYGIIDKSIILFVARLPGGHFVEYA